MSTITFRSTRPFRPAHSLIMLGLSAVFPTAAPAASVFAPASSYKIPQSHTTSMNVGPDSITVNDFNRDGKMDMGMLSHSKEVGCTSGLYFYMNQGQGGFAFNQAQRCIFLPAPQKTLVSSDFNGDGYPDIAFSDAENQRVSLIIGTSFIPRFNYPVANFPIALAVGDFNGDGRADLASANYGDDSVSVLLNNGRGSFRSSGPYPADVNPLALAVGDINGDGFSDIATANERNGTVSVLLGNGEGKFLPRSDNVIGQTPASITTADFNKDGKGDLAVAIPAANRVVLLTNTGPSFTLTEHPIGEKPVSLVAGDFNHDGMPDLAAANHGSRSVSVLFGKGDGAFKPRQDYPVGGQPHTVLASDMNGDGWTDLVTADEGRGVSLLVQRIPGDLNADGRVDVADVVWILEFSTGRIEITPEQVTVGDLNEDGGIDVRDAVLLLRRIVGM
jgi:hypothetical protein